MLHALPHVPNYTIREPVQEIPMGHIARACSLLDGQDYCCAFLRYMDMTPPNYTRLMALLDTISDMRHPNICMIREYVLNTTDKMLCVIVEDYPGRSLFDLVRGSVFLHTFEVCEIVRLATAILDALEYLHNPFTTGGSIVHLGVSLEYIYVTPEGTPKLSILPIFWSLGVLEMVNYSPEVSLYYSPQIIRHAPFSTAADIWALGIVLYFILQGELVFSRDNLGEAIFRPDFPVFTVMGPPPFQTALKSMLAINEDARVTARELLQHKVFLELDTLPQDRPLALPFPRQAMNNLQSQHSVLSSQNSRERLSTQKNTRSATDGAPPVSFLQEGLDRTGLIKAVVAGDMARFKELVPSESTLVDDIGRTALMYAAFLGYQGMVKRLLKLESRRRDHRGRTALYYAACGGHKGIVSILLPMEKGIYCFRGLTAFNLLVKEHQFQAAGFLLPAESPCRTETGLTALMVAAQDNDIEATDFLLKAEVKQRDKYGWTALMYAIKSGSNYILNTLIEAEEKVSTPEDITPLMIAASVNNVPAVSHLVQLQENKTDKHGRTALMYAAMKRSIDAGELLVKATRELSVQDSMGFTSLMYAAASNALELVPSLLSGERCKRDNSGKTAMMHATIAGHVEVVKLLLLSEAGAIDNDDYTALMYAVKEGKGEIVDILLESEAGILTTRGTGLMIAAEKGDVVSVGKLIPYEAKMQRKSGECACMLAFKANNIAAAKELLIHESHLCDKDGRGMAYYAQTAEAKLIVQGYRGRIDVEGTTKYVFE